jgi:hypothetical protein
VKYFDNKHLFLLCSALLLFSGCGGGGNTTGKGSGSVAPQFTTPATASIEEGRINIGKIETDVEGVTYSIVGGADAVKFTIDAQSGALRFSGLQDYENPADADADGTYEVTIKAETADGKSAEETFYITLTDDPSDNGDQIAPIFDSEASFTAPENEIFEATLHATDNESSVTYSIDSGADARRFRVDSASGKLTFYHLIPDFEISSDANNDKIYEVTVAATDENGNKATQDITVLIDDDPNDSTYGEKKVFKTGLADGGHGDVRSANKDGDIVHLLEREWEDTAHVDTDIGYYDAHAYCANLELAGKSDWRLPTRRELFELVDYGNNPKIDAAFINKNGGYFWTSQELFPYDGAPGDENKQAWTIQFGNGIDYASNKDETNGYHVRCVRGYTIPNGQFKKNSNSTIIDTTTNIVWENNITAIDPTLTWDEAKTRCADLILDGKDDWRLPNINELHSIIPNNDNEYQFTELTEQKTGPYWSSSAYLPTLIYYVENYWDAPNLRDVQNDALINPDNNGSVRSRCIRGGN